MEEAKVEEVKDGKSTAEAQPQVVVETQPTPERSTLKVKARGPEDEVVYLNTLIHGNSGTGKTRFAGTMVEAGLKTLFIVFNEDELLTLDRAKVTGYDYLVIRDYEKQLWPLYLALRKNQPHYEGVVLDGLGDFQQAAKDYELAGDDRVGAKFMEAAMKGERRMFLANWGNLLEMTRHFIDPFLKLPFHKIVTCVSEVDEDPTTGKAKIYPALQGSLQQLIAAHFSVVGYTYIAHRGSDTHYCLTTQPHEAISTKDRTGLCRVLVNPKFKSFMGSLRGNPPPSTDLEQKLSKQLVLRIRSTAPQVQVASDKEKEERSKASDS